MKIILFAGLATTVFALFMGLCPIRAQAIGRFPITFHDTAAVQARLILSQRGEVYFRFPVQPPRLVSQLTRTLSIDKIKGDFVYAYANERQFTGFLSHGISWELLPPPSSGHYLKSETLQGDPVAWDRYPSYGEYIDRMHSLADSFPGICRIDTIGYSVFNRLILAAGISGNSSFGTGKPLFLYTSSIHGDETTGYMLLLRLIDYLLHGYGKDSLITKLADRLEIWINPLANPDGTYFLGDAGVYMATRFNHNGIDLNRNFPDPAEGQHPDGQPWQPETLAMMEFMKKYHPDMSANLHSGTEVVNYPWDSWTQWHADDNWFRMVSMSYADTVIASSTGYFLQFENGITRGADWYRITGGRQDFVTYFLHGREITIELSLEKLPPAYELPVLWGYNRKALLHLMEQSLYGLSGTITDPFSGEPLRAEITVPGHDDDNSYVFSDSLTGVYHRFLKEGTYTIRIRAQGYQARTVEQVNVYDGQTTNLDIVLEREETGIEGIHHPPAMIIAGSRIIYFLEQAGTATLQVYDLTGRQMLPAIRCLSEPGRNEIELNNNLLPGNYLFRLTFHGRSISYISSFNF